MSIDQITVLGAGTMGHGIAVNAATAGYTVILHDINQAAIDAGLARAHAFLDKGVERGKTTKEQRDQALQRLSGEVDFGAAVSHADLVIEADREILYL